MGKKCCCKHGTPFNQKLERYGLYNCSCCNSQYEDRNKERLCPGCRGDLKTQKKIMKTKEKLHIKIAQLEQKLYDLRKECTHPRVVKKGCSDTGNWCKGDDRYWYDFTCPDCGERWTEDQ